MEKIQFKDLPDMTTPLSSANLNQMQDNMENAIIPIKLVSISDTAPESANIGDMYYNTTDNKIYTATAENTWDSGNIPRYDGFYVNKENNAIYYYNGETLSGINSIDTTPIGMIMQYAGVSIPERWMKCEGQTLSRTDYSELFSVIGTTYGSGDGSTTFNLPNLEGRFPIGYKSSDTDFNMLGKKGGSKTHTQTVDEMPRHRHKNDNGDYGTTDGFYGVATNTPQGSGGDVYTLYEGNSQPMDIMNPYIVLNYCIKVL